MNVCACKQYKEVKVKHNIVFISFSLYALKSYYNRRQCVKSEAYPISTYSKNRHELHCFSHGTVKNFGRDHC